MLPRALKSSAVAMLAVVSLIGTSCTTTYDAYGRPVQSVDPGTAAAGVAAAGLLGYAVAKDNDKHHHNYNHGRHGYYDRYGRYHRY